MLTGTALSTVDIKTGKIRDLLTIPNDPFSMTWAPDGQIHLITGTPIDKDSGERAVYSVDPTSGPTELVKVACGVDDDAESLLVMGGKLLVNRAVKFESVIGELGGRDLFRRDTDLWATDTFADPTLVP